MGECGNPEVGHGGGGGMTQHASVDESVMPQGGEGLACSAARAVGAQRAAGVLGGRRGLVARPFAVVAVRGERAAPAVPPGSCGSCGSGGAGLAILAVLGVPGTHEG